MIYICIMYMYVKSNLILIYLCKTRTNLISEIIVAIDLNKKWCDKFVCINGSNRDRHTNRSVTVKNIVKNTERIN